MTDSNKKQVVITAAGPVTAIGIGQDCFTAGILENESGIMEIAAFEHDQYHAHNAAAVEDFEVDDFLATPKNYLDRNTELSFGAFSLALEASGIDLEQADKSQIALIWSTAFGGSDTMNLFYKDVQTKGPRFGKPILFPHTYSNTPVSMLSIEYKLNGPHMNFVSGWTASGQALAYGYDLITNGQVPMAFVGGAEAFNETVFRYNLAKNNLATDKNSDGAVMGEGSGMLVLEDAGSAAQRGADIMAEVYGIGMSGSVETAMSSAIENAGLTVADVDLVITSANGIPEIDKVETGSIKNILGDIETFNVKSLIGETFGAAGILQLHAALSILENRDKTTILINNCDITGNTVSVIVGK